MNLLNLGVEVIAFDISKKRLFKIQKEYKNVTIFEDMEEALSQELNGVIICTPTSMHIPVAIATA
ncbi:unnamed protein product, partial [marine sediment metagenome]